MTYGEYLKKILENKNIKPSELALIIGIKSKNEIYRLFSNYYSYEKSSKINNMIIKNINLNKEEKDTLLSLLESCKIKQSTLTARKILSDIYAVKPYNEFILSTETKDINISYFFNSLKYSGAKIFISNHIDQNILLEIEHFLSNNHDANIAIYHFIEREHGKLDLANNLISIISLIKYPQYNPYKDTQIIFNGTIILLYDKLYVIDKISKCDKFRYVETEISPDFCKYINENFKIMKSRSVPLKKTLDKMPDYITMLSKYSILDKENAFSINGGICFTSIPFKFMERLLKEANYFGMSPESPYIIDLISKAKFRSESAQSVFYKKRMVFTTNKIEDFLKTGKTADHIKFFKGLNKREVNFITKEIKKSNFRFLKSDTIKHAIDFVPNKIFIAYNSDLGYDTGNYSFESTNPKVLELFEDFINYLWDELCFSKEESQDILDNLIKKHLKK